MGDPARIREHAALAQSVERILGKDEVLGSNPRGSFWVCCPRFGRAKELCPVVGPEPLGDRPKMDLAVGRPGGFPAIDFWDAE